MERMEPTKKCTEAQNIFHVCINVIDMILIYCDMI